MDKNIGKKVSKSLSGKYSPSMLPMRQKLIDHDKKNLQQMTLKLLEKEQFKK